MDNQASAAVSRDIEQIWTSEMQYVRRMLIGLTRDIDLADDLLQETYINARSGFSGCRGDNNRAWLSAIARNVFLGHIRRRYVSAETSDDTTDTACYSPVGCGDHLELINVRQAISQLDPDLRTTLLMKHYCGFTYREIAKHTGCAVGTAKWRVSRAVGKLKETLGIGEEPVEITCADISRIRLLDYLYGTLGPDEAQAVNRHIQGCLRCKSRLEGTDKILSALDVLEGTNKLMHIIELNRDGRFTLYSTWRLENFSQEPMDEHIFCATRSYQLQHISAGGEELAFDYGENSNSDYPGTYLYQVKLPQPLAPGETLDLMSIYYPEEQHTAKQAGGAWEFGWGQLTSVDSESAYLLAIRLPLGASLESAEPPVTEVKGDVATTLLWRRLLEPNEGFGCSIKYRLADTTKP